MSKIKLRTHPGHTQVHTMFGTFAVNKSDNTIEVPGHVAHEMVKVFGNAYQYHDPSDNPLNRQPPKGSGHAKPQPDAPRPPIVPAEPQPPVSFGGKQPVIAPGAPVPETLKVADDEEEEEELTPEEEASLQEDGTDDEEEDAPAEALDAFKSGLKKEATPAAPKKAKGKHGKKGKK